MRLSHAKIEDQCFPQYSNEQTTSKARAPSCRTFRKRAIIPINNAGDGRASRVTSAYRSHLLSSGDVLQNFLQLLLDASGPVNHSAKTKTRDRQHRRLIIITQIHSFLQALVRLASCHTLPLFGMPVWKYPYPYLRLISGLDICTFPPYHVLHISAWSWQQWRRVCPSLLDRDQQFCDKTAQV